MTSVLSTPPLALAATLLLQAASVPVLSVGGSELPVEALAQTTVDGSVPRRRLAHMDFEESEEFTAGQARGFSRLLTHAPRGAASAPASATTLPGYPDFGEISMRRGIGRIDAPSDPGNAGSAPRNHGWAIGFTNEGASMAYIGDPQLVAVEPGALVATRVWVRTSGLEVAGARVGVRFHDASGAPIGGIHSSAVVRSETGWTPLEVAPPPAPEGSRGMAIWLELVQPAASKPIEDASIAVARSDVRGEVYFDDLEVWQLPAIGLEALDSGLVDPLGSARLRVRCSDPMHDTARVAVRVRDTADRTVHEAALEVPDDAARVVELPQLPTGWYEAEAVFTQGAERLGRRLARFAVLPDDPFEPDEPPRFGATLERRDMPLGPALDLARAAFVVLPAWTAETDARDTAHEIRALRPLVAQIVDRRVEPMFRLAGIPAAIAQENRLDTDDLLALFALDAARWQPSLEPWLLAFGQEVDQWFLGNEPIDSGRVEVAARVESLARAMRNAVAGPAVGVPWPQESPLPADLLGAVVTGRHVLEVVVDPQVAAAPGSAEAEDRAVSSGVEASSGFEGFPTGPRGMARIVPLPPGSLGDRERAIELALRGIEAWRAGFDDIAVEVHADNQPPVPGPPLELAAWRQLSTRLCGRRFVAEIPVAAGVKALLADGARGPVLAMWSEAEESIDISVDLGSRSVFATDLWGRSARIAPTAAGHALRVGREPVFVEEIDRAMCLLRRGFRVDPAFVESRRTQQDATLVLGNPWTVPITGTLTLLGPDGLSLTPRVHRFTIAPGEEGRLPVSLSVPRALPAGEIVVRAKVEGTAEEPFRATMEAPLEIGYRKATVTPAWRLARSIESGSVDLVLSLRVTNVSDAPIDVEAFAVADGFMQDRKPILALAPGKTAVRVFHFPDGARRLAGGEIRAGVHDMDGDARLLRTVSVPAFDATTGGLAGATEPSGQ